jgi:hypothetical protein
LDPEGVPLPVPYVCLEHSDVEYAAGFEDPLYTSAKLGKEELVLSFTENNGWGVWKATSTFHSGTAGLTFEKLGIKILPTQYEK